MFHKIASMFVLVGTKLVACIHQMFVWFATVVTVVIVQVTAVVLQASRVALTSHCVQNILARGASLETYSSIVSKTHLRVHNGW